MNDKLSIINRLLDWFKLVLVRFKNAGFGIFFIKNLFILPEFFKDREANVFSKLLYRIFHFNSITRSIPKFMFFLK
ncbi:hypothetical protein [uncultured Intestinibacter sp.]|uniref:hypothetical protein n=1 Tax=uncultured Intestinibacter sp. TaxID=1505659 RepID=UPI0027DB058A|nr:hypothetical protein [uncultured Intestinibacter sp.]